MKKKSVSRTCGTIAGLALLTTTLLAFNGYSQDSNFHIYLAFGQSNMEGYPGVEAQDKTGVNARFQLLPAVNWSDGSRTKGTWTTAVPPLCRGDGPGLCPCDYFGRTLVDSLPSGIKVGIINVAVAGCAIEMFDKDKYSSYLTGQASWMKAIVTTYGGNPYARLLEMGKAAQKDGVIRGFLLHQGESGSSTGQWANEVKLIYNNLITDLGLDASKIPLLAGDLVGSSSMIKNLPTTLSSAHYVSSTGLANRGDGLHFSAQGYRDFGKRYADTMLRILRKQGISSVTKGNNGVRAGYALENSVTQRNGEPAFSFEIPQRAVVRLQVCTLSGKVIAERGGVEYSAGRHTIGFGRNALRTGVFVLKMTSGPFSATRTVLAGAQ